MRQTNLQQSPDLPNCVLGYLFSADRLRVLLVLKNRPAFLAGLYNGIGGKVERSETYPLAMEREFEEETGIQVGYHRWKNYLTMSVRSDTFQGVYTVECYKTFADNEYEFNSFQQKEDESKRVFEVNKLPVNIVPNLKWMIPLALNDNIRKSSVIYHREQ